MKTVMVVEDDVAVLDLLDIVLRDAGYLPVLVATSEQVPQRVMSERPDVILLDMLIEPSPGMEVLASILKMGNHPPVIMMSAEVVGARVMQRIARSLGAADFIEKPFDISQLLDKLEDALRTTA